MEALAFFVAAYLLGSIPFGLLFTKVFLKKDIRGVGSGNIGATNVLRTGNKSLALLVLTLDFFKGFLAVLLWEITKSDFDFSPQLDRIVTVSAGLFATLGHCFPIWLKFKGGKGVATTFGVLFAAVPWAGFIAAVTWGIVAGFSRYSSLSAMCAVAIALVVTLLYYGAAPAMLTMLIAALVIWRHKDNIQRLIAGTESKIGQKDKDEPAADTE